MTVTDALARPLRDLRISVTDRCNFRCVYCMPREVFGRDYEFLERAELLTFEEIERLARIFVGDHGGCCTKGVCPGRLRRCRDAAELLGV